jgi:hypothetical protein
MAQIIAQFKPNGTYEPDTCDALLRRFKETAANGAIIAWRHYLETDFGVIGLSRASHVSRIRFGLHAVSIFYLNFISATWTFPV